MNKPYQPGSALIRVGALNGDNMVITWDVSWKTVDVEMNGK